MQLSFALLMTNALVTVALGVKVIPEVVKLLSLDVYRDGGSLSALFADRDGTQHELAFLIKHTKEQHEPIKQYKEAVIKSFIKNKYVSPVTGLSTDKFDKKEKSITWNDAIELLNKISPLIEEFKSDLNP
jgi:hypothetical protein